MDKLAGMGTITQVNSEETNKMFDVGEENTKTPFRFS